MHNNYAVRWMRTWVETSSLCFTNSIYENALSTTTVQGCSDHHPVSARSSGVDKPLTHTVNYHAAVQQLVDRKPDFVRRFRCYTHCTVLYCYQMCDSIQNLTCMSGVSFHRRSTRQLRSMYCSNQLCAQYSIYSTLSTGLFLAWLPCEQTDLPPDA